MKKNYLEKKRTESIKIGKVSQLRLYLWWQELSVWLVNMGPTRKKVRA